MSETVARRVAELRQGAQLLRNHPDRITHTELVSLVADWIDAEALMWETSHALVELMNGVTAEVSGRRAGKVHFAEVNGKPETVLDTSTHADRIIAAVKGNQP